MHYAGNTPFSKPRSVIVFFTMALVAGTFLQPAAALANKDKAQGAFTSFAEKWMANLENVTKQNRSKANVRQEGNHYYVEYVAYGPDWTAEIKETGEPSAPYVGFIKYPEKVMMKEGQSAAEASQCAETVSTQVPVTEIFRYSQGKWQY